jgi:hypothetical protein
MLLGRWSESFVQAAANKTYMYMGSVAISMSVTYKMSLQTLHNQAQPHMVTGHCQFETCFKTRRLHLTNNSPSFSYYVYAYRFRYTTYTFHFKL